MQATKATPMSTGVPSTKQSTSAVERAKRIQAQRKVLLKCVDKKGDMSFCKSISERTKKERCEGNRYTVKRHCVKDSKNEKRSEWRPMVCPPEETNQEEFYFGGNKETRKGGIQIEQRSIFDSISGFKY